MFNATFFDRDLYEVVVFVVVEEQLKQLQIAFKKEYDQNYWIADIYVDCPVNIADMEDETKRDQLYCKQRIPRHLPTCLPGLVDNMFCQGVFDPWICSTTMNDGFRFMIHVVSEDESRKVFVFSEKCCKNLTDTKFDFIKHHILAQSLQESNFSQVAYASAELRKMHQQKEKQTKKIES